MTIAIVNGQYTRLCTVPGCTRHHHAHGFCDMHYYRVLRHGDPSKVTLTYSDCEPQVIPVGLVPDDAGLPMPYSAALQARRTGLERRDSDRDARDYAVSPHFAEAYEREATRWRGDAEWTRERAEVAA